ncbi:MAG: hypothetical protein A4E57_01233 [Syntrophorhabdaceae bacterium PtaU1.Bin034]|nr:MAG: hypothetical protein A4E57_01233 [Syntrophorhabdaceae bacterium PtaU1.Bin034]
MTTPLSYEDIFERLGSQGAISLAEKQIRFAGLPVRREPLPGLGDDLIPYFLKNCTTLTYLKQVARVLPYAELKQLRRIIRRGVARKTDKRIAENWSLVESLLRKGLIISAKNNGEEIVFAPLEVCFGIPFDSEESSSLLMSFNQFPADVVKSIANFRGEAVSGHKVKLATAVYRSILKTYDETISSLAPQELDLARRIFLRGGRIGREDLLAWADYPPAVKMGHSYGYSLSGDDILRFLDNTYVRKRDDLSPFYRIVLSLLTKGVLSISLREVYDRFYEYFIPRECLERLSVIFFAEMDAKRESVSRGLYTEAPAACVSYGGRILNDMIMARIASVCGLVENTMDGKPKKRSVTQVARLLGADEPYLYNLFQSFPSYLWEGKSDHNLVEPAEGMDEYLCVVQGDPKDIEKLSGRRVFSPR